MISKLNNFWNRSMLRFTTCWEAMTEDFNRSSDCFFGIDYLMVIGGVHLSSTNVVLRRCWNLYRSLMALTLILVTWKMALNVIHRNGLDRVLNNLQLVIGTFMVLTKAVLIRLNLKPLFSVRQFLNLRQGGRDQDASHPIRSQAFYCIRRVAISTGMVQFCLIVTLLSQDLSDNNSFGLPFDLRNFSPLLQTICQKMYCIPWFGLTAMALTTNLTIFMLLKGLLTELTVVVECFKTTMDRAILRTDGEIQPEIGHPDRLRFNKRHYFWLFLHEEFRKCIHMHQTVIKHLNIVKPMLNSFFLILYFITILTIASGVVYLLAAEPSQIDIYTILIFYYTGLLLFECWIMAYLVTKLTEMNATVGDTVYTALDWASQLAYSSAFDRPYRATVNTMLTVMAYSAHQQLGLNCFGLLSEFTLQQFAELVQQTYSLVTFFRNFV